MKKVYTKPEIIFDSFSLSTNIAGSCAVIFDGQAPYECGISDDGPGLTIFTEDFCMVVPPDGLYNGLCYHVPFENQNYFAS